MFFCLFLLIKLKQVEKIFVFKETSAQCFEVEEPRLELNECRRQC